MMRSKENRLGSAGAVEEPRPQRDDLDDDEIAIGRHALEGYDDFTDADESNEDRRRDPLRR